MKNLVKVLFAAFVLVAVSSGAFAQSTASVAASANVITDVSYTAVHDLAFGNISLTNGAKTIDVDNSNAGAIKITKSAASDITVTLTFPTFLTLKTNYTAVSEKQLTFESGKWVAALSASNTGLSGNLGTSISTNTLGNDYTNAGDFWVYFGGTLTPKANQVTGAYEGTISLSALYN